MRYKSTLDPSAFFASLSPSGCWEWQGARDKDGYGQTRSGMTRVKAHRKAWEIVNGPVPDGMDVLHRCNNEPCCRPDHLYVGTTLDNGIDRHAKTRPHRANYNFSPAEIADIRSRYATGTISQKALAAEYGVIQTTISRIVLGKSYRFDVAPRSNSRKRQHS